MKFIPRSESTRNFIIEACAEVFNKKGFSGTSVTDLEKATGLTKGSIYGNFENKDAVALAVFDYNLEQRTKLIQTQVDQCNSYREKLRMHVLVYSSEAKMPFISGGCPLQNTAVEADDTHEEFRQRAASGLLSWMQGLMDIIHNGMLAKEFKSSTIPMETALHIISLIEGATMFGKATQNIEYRKLLLDVALKVVDDIEA